MGIRILIVVLFIKALRNGTNPVTSRLIVSTNNLKLMVSIVEVMEFQLS